MTVKRKTPRFNRFKVLKHRIPNSIPKKTKVSSPHLKKAARRARPQTPTPKPYKRVFSKSRHTVQPPKPQPSYKPRRSIHIDVVAILMWLAIAALLGLVIYIIGKLV